MHARILRFFAFGVGVSLVALALPSFSARLAMLEGDGAVAKLYEARAIAPQEREAVVASRRAALFFAEPLPVARDLALVASREAEAFAEAQKDQALFASHAETERKRQILREEALAAQWRDLSQTPVNPYGWARVVDFLQSSQADSVAAARVKELQVRALLLSFDAAPYEPRLLVSRLRRFLSLWYDLPRDRQVVLSHLVRQAWDYDKKALVQAARDDHFLMLVESVLTDNPRDLAAFQALSSEGQGGASPLPASEARRDE